jgi:hypothetical protein
MEPVAAGEGVVMAVFSPSQTPEDLAIAERYLRERSVAELTQIITAPTVLLNRLPGFTTAHLRTADEFMVVNLAQNEINRRERREARRVMWLSLAVSGASALAAIAAAVTAWLAYLARRC